MKVYDPRTQGGYRERNAQVIEAFNGASQNAIRLTSASKPGDFDMSAFFRRQSGLVTRRDTASVATVADQAMQQDETAAVKINRRVGPVNVTADAIRKVGRGVGPDEDPEDAVMWGLGGAVADKVAEDKLNIALAAVAAAVRAQAGATNDTSGAAGGVTSSKLNTTLYKRGDRAADVKMFVMHSAKFAELVDQQISTNATGIASVVLAGGSPLTFNRPVLVTDSPSLIVAGAPNKYVTLGLVDSAVMVEDTEEELIIGDWVTGLENLAMRMQGEYAYNLSLDGFSWDVANGGANPTDAALATATNWDVVVQDAVKSIAGVALYTQ
jgi:Major capsid protein 13-like